MIVKCPRFKKEDGTECYIVIAIHETYNNDDFFYLDTIMYRNPPKRKWNSLKYELRNSYQYYGMTNDEKCKIIDQKMEEFAGEYELKQAMQYAWESIKPKCLC